MKKITAASLALAICLVPFGEVKAQEDVDLSLTVYNSNPQGSYRSYGSQLAPGGFALVSRLMDYELEAGEVIIEFDAIQSLIPTTVMIRSRSNPNALRVLDQVHFGTGFNMRETLRSRIGEEIGVQTADPGMTWGTLLAFDGEALVLAVDDKHAPVQIILGEEYIRRIHLRDEPNLLSAPGLLWRVDNSVAGVHEIEISYQVDNIGWRADYMATLNSDETRMDLAGRAAVANQSGEDYEDAALKLIAGEVQRFEEQKSMDGSLVRMEMAQASYAPTPQFQETTLSEYHIYTLGRRADIPNNATVQIELFPEIRSIPVEKKYVVKQGQPQYHWSSPITSPNWGVSTEEKKVDVVYEFGNDTVEGPGIPLPAGRFRIYKEDNAGMRQFLGEDRIGHTPVGKDLRLSMGKAFDVTAERRQVDFQRNDGWMRETIEITARNGKSESIEVFLIEPVSRWSQWRIEKSSLSYRELDASTLEFRLPVPANGKASVTYTVFYTW